MFLLIILWFVFFAGSFGITGFVFLSMRKAVSRPWRINVDDDYKPKISIIVPTYNESAVIAFKLQNLNKLEYPKELTQIIVVDSRSEDQTVNVVDSFIKEESGVNLRIIRDSERRGKSAALNNALKQCEGDVIIVSDADCFWPSGILRESLPFLADPSVGAISGPKLLLNPDQSWVTASEEKYMESHNRIKLGESKINSTVFFEGGFSAYKKGVIDAFDPYNTGADDAGTVMKVLEKNLRAILVPQARFFTTFPVTWEAKVGIKARRGNQLVRVFMKYAGLLAQRRIANSKRVILQNILLYLLTPFMFVLLLVVTAYFLLMFPYLVLAFLLLLVPQVRRSFFEVIQSYIVLLLSIVSVAFGKRTLVWGKPPDRNLATEEMLHNRMLI